MHALLILENDNVTNLRVLVTVRNKKLKKEIIFLLQENRVREAFELLKSRAEVRAYLPKGSKLLVTPEIILFEDLL